MIDKLHSFTFLTVRFLGEYFCGRCKVPHIAQGIVTTDDRRILGNDPTDFQHDGAGFILRGT